MKVSRFPFLFLQLFLILLATSCSENKNEPSASTSSDPKIQNLKLPDGFHADHLYGPSNNGEGSWVSMTFDDKGRLLASDQYGAIYRMDVPKIGDTATKIKVEQLEFPGAAGDSASKKVRIGYAHGLLYAFNSLYVVVNDEGDTSLPVRSGLYRLQDTNGDDQFDKITLLKRLDGEGEHGPHNVILSPDKKSLYLIAGNFTKIPKMDSYANYADSKLDNLLPLLKDPNGHDNTVNWHGGWIAHTDSLGSKWELFASGFRNPFDMAFNDAGDLFTYDSDMEWDFGLPWYRPTRICHVPKGAEFGWRPGDDKWSPVFPDNLPAVLNIGQGSPTNVVSGLNARFPEKYRRSVFAFDWSFGIIYAVHLDPKGASYDAKGEEFVSGSPLPLTDGVIGPDGALYFLTGGRRLESDLYRVYYGNNTDSAAPLSVPALSEAQNLRRQLESFDGAADPKALDVAWPNLKHDDRYIRYAARMAVEHQPVETWRAKVFAEKDPVTLIQASIALAKKGSAADESKLITALKGIDFSKLSEAQQIDLVRAFEVVIARLGKPDAASSSATIAYLDPHYPAKGGNELNRELIKVLAYLQSPTVVSKTMAMLDNAKDDNSAGQQQFTSSSDLIMRNPQYGLDIASTLAKLPPAQQTFYTTALSPVKTGWTPELREKYFTWFHTAFGFRGGHSFPGFLDEARKTALANVPKDKFAHFDQMSVDSVGLNGGMNLAKAAIQPKGPYREWTVDEAVKVVDSGNKHPDFVMGESMYRASYCVACHTMNGQGGTAGPDLTQLGTRFSTKDMLESIIEPNKVISDQYQATIFELKNGSSVVGRMISQDKDKYVVSQNPFAQQTTRDILKADVAKTKASPVSPMLPGMINPLNADELRQLITYLMAGGNKESPVYKK